MPTHHIEKADCARSTSDRLLAALETWRNVEKTEAKASGLRSVNANRATIEHARGALMLRFGIDSHQAFAVMVRWSRVTHTPVEVIAHTLVHGICEGNPQTERRQRPLLRWLEDQLRHNDLEPARVPGSPVWSPTST